MSRSPIPERKLYSDFFTNLDIHPVNNDVAVKINEESVKQSIRNILLTNRGERLFQPYIGGNLKAMLFENMSPQTVVTMTDTIKETLRVNEPRARLIDVIVSPNYEKNFVNVVVVFSLINSEEPVTVETILKRVR